MQHFLACIKIVFQLLIRNVHSSSECILSYFCFSLITYFILNLFRSFYRLITRKLLNYGNLDLFFVTFWVAVSCHIQKVFNPASCMKISVQHTFLASFCLLQKSNIVTLYDTNLLGLDDKCCDMPIYMKFYNSNFS